MIQCKHTEGVAVGTLRLVGTDEETIVRSLGGGESYKILVKRS